MKSPPEILLFSPSANGGIAEHTFYQANALAKAGAKVICLVPPAFLHGRRMGFEKAVCLANPVPLGGLKLLRRTRLAWRTVISRWRLAWEIIKRRPDLVLLDSYVEYLAPFWIWPHWLLACLVGIKYAANLHDPIRNYIVGPEWWHWLSVRLAYLPLDFVLVHDKLPEPSPVPSNVRTVQIPHGLYEISGPESDPSAIRREWAVHNGQKVFLAFGFVRDDKNLDIAIQALAQVPEAFLAVAGSVASSKDKPFAFYRELATNLGVGDRCRFFNGFVADAEVRKYFAGADFVLLTYGSSFHSQSGVLNIAARARKPVLASASPGSLIESVTRFRLGVAVKPDCVEAVVSGMRRLISACPTPRWDAYETSASWDVNARNVCEAAGFPVDDS